MGNRVKGEVESGCCAVVCRQLQKLLHTFGRRLRCRMPCILFSCEAERMNNWFPLPESRAVSLPLSDTHWLATHTAVVSHSFVSWFRPPPYSLSLTLTQKSVSLFVYPFVCLFVGCVTLFICLSLSSHATYFLPPLPALALGPALLHLPPPTLLSWHCFFRLSLISLFSFIPICVCYCRWSQSPLRPFVRVPPLHLSFLLCNLCFTFPRAAFLLLLIGICFGLVACFDFNPVQTHFVVAMALCPWSLTRAALTLCRFAQHINILYIVFVYIFNVHNTLSLQGICNANVTLELYVAWP